LMLTLLMLATANEASAIQDTVKKQDDKKLIRMLLKERKDRFAQYTEHLDDRSGFFGNQTKKDLKEINEVLKEIVRTDNKIIMELDRLLDQRKFETFRSEFETKRAGQELVELQMENKKLMAANDTLLKQLEMHRDAGEARQDSRIIYVFLTYFFGALLVFMFLTRWRKREAKA
jgi:predicted class III extradiol MEMO1 family dioxygenase